MLDLIQWFFDGASVWGNRILLVVIVVTLVGSLRLWRSEAALPTGKRLTRVITSWWSLSLLLAVVGLYLINIRMAPMTGALATLQAETGTKVRDLSFRRVSDDAPLKLHEFRGQIVVLNLWATWCPPCLDEIPALERLQMTYSEKGLVVIALSDESREHLLEFFEDRPAEMVVAYTDRFGWLAIETFRPLTLIIDREGVLRDHLLGARSLSGFEDAVQPYL